MKFGLSVVLVIFSIQSVVFAKPRFTNQGGADPALLPIEKSLVNKDLVDDLFPPDEDEDTVGPKDNTKPVVVRNGGNNRNNNGRNGGNNFNNGNKNNDAVVDFQTMTTAQVKNEFKCNLFENTPYEDMLSAVNSLNQAVNSPSCSGASKMDVKGIVDSNTKIQNAVSSLRGYLDNPDSVPPEKATDIVNSVDTAIRAANSIANAFAQSDLLNDQCRKQMNGGQVALALNDIVNGLTPYALMAAQMTGGTAAIPFIVGGSIVTGAISSMGKIIEENSVNVYDSQVRRAIVENTCQYIRLDQKYKFLIKNRSEQIQKISAELSSSQQLFSAKMSGFSGATNNMINRKNFLDKTSLDLNNKVSSARSRLELDKQFLNGTTDELKMCQLGIQMAVMAKDTNSYVSVMLASLDEAMNAYGTNNVAQAKALKTSAVIAVNSLNSMAPKQFSVNSSFKNCATVTKSFIETVDQSATLAKQLVKMAQADNEKGLQGSSEYGLFKQRLNSLNQKQLQAERVTNSLDNLKRYATSLTQSEIDSEMDRLRRGLLAPRSMGMPSPVNRWFTYVRGLHQAAISKFRDGLTGLRKRAYNLTASGKAEASPSLNQRIFGVQVTQKDRDDSYNLYSVSLQTLPLGTQEHDATCREMQDVWNRWVVAVDHLAAMDSFCGMIEPYIYDNRSEDRELVMTCRGFSAASGGAKGASISAVASLKDQLVKGNIRDWALYLKKKIDAMVCVDGALN
jgi:hypothetical protein